MTFWILVAGLVGVALASSAWPLLRRLSAAAPEHGVPEHGAAVVRALYRDRLAELERESEASGLDPATRAQVVDELSANLLDDFRQHETGRAGVRPAGPGRAAGILMLLLVPLAGLLVYLAVGEPSARQLAGATVLLQLDPDTEQQALREWRDRLARRVAQRPDDSQSWYLLAVSLLQLGEFRQAADAFEVTHTLVGEDPNVDLYWLQARYLAADAALDATTRGIAQRVLQRQPNHPLVLELLAIDAYRNGAYRESVEFLNRALNNDLAPHQLRALLAGLGEARRQLGDLESSIDVTVDRPEALPENGVVFVIARPPGGGVPFAAVRRPAALLPLTVRLDDTVSMNPELPLSQADAVEVVVRLSLRGTAMAGPGDWSWRSGPVALDADQPVALSARLEPPSTPVGGAAVGETPEVPGNREGT